MEEEHDKIAMKIGNLVLEYINPLVIQVSGHIQEKGMNGKLILSYTGTTTDKIKKEVKE